MEYLSKLEKFVLAYLWHEYGGSLYFSRGSETPERFLARSIVDELVKGRRPHFYEQLFQGLINAFKKLSEYWMLQLSGFEVSLTSYGMQVAKNISKEDYERLKAEIASGKIQ